MRYPETVNLPFNSRVISENFVRGQHDKEPSDGALYAVIQGSAMILQDRDGVISLPNYIPHELNDLINRPLYIGSWEGRPLFVYQACGSALLPQGFTVEPFNSNKDRLDDILLTIGGMAMQILHWDLSSRVCPYCGGGVEWLKGAWGKRCLACGKERFPAIHPCAIVLVKRGEEFLLTRKSEWAKGRYSLVAGFLDFTESLEECAVREVKEETGIDITNVRYVGSQCWPFPSQLMAGFTADYLSGEIMVDTDEIEDAAWFSKNCLPESFPPFRSIARWIIENHAF